jgi:hypothetical protein
MRHALRVDANQEAVISALEAAGAIVMVLGLPVDLLVGLDGHETANGRFAFFEVKDGKKSPSRIKKTKVQEKFFSLFAGYPVCLVDSPETALRHLKVLRSKT